MEISPPQKIWANINQSCYWLKKKSLPPLSKSEACASAFLLAWLEYSGTEFGVERSVKVDDKVQVEPGALQSDHLFHKYVLSSSCLTNVGEVSVLQYKHILQLGILYKLEVCNLVIICKIM